MKKLAVSLLLSFLLALLPISCASAAQQQLTSYLTDRSNSPLLNRQNEPDTTDSTDAGTEGDNLPDIPSPETDNDNLPDIPDTEIPSDDPDLPPIPGMDETTKLSGPEIECEPLTGEYAVLTMKAGQYSGYVEDDIPNGYGQFTNDDSSQYLGMFKDGLYDGIGMYVFARDNASGYVMIAGQFSQGKLNGAGSEVFIDSNNNVVHISGQYSEGKRVNGTYTKTINSISFAGIEYLEGGTYGGEFSYETEAPEGFGCFMYTDKADVPYVHLGEFKNGIPDGPGIQLHNDDSYFVGEWENGLLKRVTEMMELNASDVTANTLKWPLFDPFSGIIIETIASNALPEPEFDCYMSFDIKDSSGRWETVVLPQYDWAYSSVEDGFQQATVTGNFGFFGNYANAVGGSNYETMLIIPAFVRTGDVIMTNNIVGKEFVDTGFFIQRSYPSLNKNIYTDTDKNNLVRINPKNSFLSIKLISVENSYDSTKYIGSFRATWGSGEDMIQIENGRFVLNVSDI